MGDWIAGCLCSSVCPVRPWESAPDYHGKEKCFEDPVLERIAQDREGYRDVACCPRDDMDCCWKVKCPTTGETRHFNVLPRSDCVKPEVYESHAFNNCPVTKK